MAIHLPPEKITMKRVVAHAVFYLSCLSSSLATCTGAELSSSWQSLGQAKISKKSRTAVPFQPELSLEQNNRKLNDHRANSVIVSSTVPVSSLPRIQLVNHAARWQLENQTFSGRVTAVMLSEDQQSLTVFVEIADPQLKTQEFSGHKAGFLSVEG
jgi:ribosome-binding factor A